MTEKLATAGEVALTLTPQERDFLTAMLNEEIGDVRVEVRRTQTSSLREKLVQREEVLKSLLAKIE